MTAIERGVYDLLLPRFMHGTSNVTLSRVAVKLSLEPWQVGNALSSLERKGFIVYSKGDGYTLAVCR